MRPSTPRLLPPLLLGLALLFRPAPLLAQSTSLSWQCQTPAQHPPSGAQCPVTAASPLPVTADAAANTILPSADITVSDSGSATATGAYGQPIVTGTPTTGSAAVATAIPSESAYSITISGTWSGTLNFERSSDSPSGTTWVPSPVYISGSNYGENIGSTTGNGVYKGSAAAATAFRVRASGAWSGTAHVQITHGEGNFAIFVVNPTQVWNQQSGNILAVNASGALSAAPAGASFAHVASNTTTLVKSGAGVLNSVCINSKGASANTATFYNNTAGSGTVIAVLDTTEAPTCFSYGTAFSTGLTVVTATGTAGDLTITFQ